jgi:predicted nucleic acid-binding protein
MAVVMTDVLLDSGFFIGHEKADSRCRMWLQLFNDRNVRLATVATNVAEVWRNGGRQVRLMRLMPAVEVIPVDLGLAQAAGELMARTGSSSTVDALLVAAAVGRHAAVLTGDPGDIAPLAAVVGVEIMLLGKR